MRTCWATVVLWCCFGLRSALEAFAALALAFVAVLRAVFVRGAVRAAGDAGGRAAGEVGLVFFSAAAARPVFVARAFAADAAVERLADHVFAAARVRHAGVTAALMRLCGMWRARRGGGRACGSCARWAAWAARKSASRCSAASVRMGWNMVFTGRFRPGTRGRSCVRKAGVRVY